MTAVTAYLLLPLQSPQLDGASEVSKLRIELSALVESLQSLRVVIIIIIIIITIIIIIPWGSSRGTGHRL